MAELPPSLGQEVKRDFHLVGQEYPLPKSRQELISAFEGILSQGGVQKVIVEIGKPIKVSRYMPLSTAPEEAVPTDLVFDDLFSNARNAEMEEFDPGTPDNWYEGLFKAFRYIGQKKLTPRAFMVKSLDLLRGCLELPKTTALTELFGIDIVTADEIPPDVLLFSATRPGEDEIVLSLRILMSTR